MQKVSAGKFHLKLPLGSHHSITSSARTSSIVGISRPSALALRKLGHRDATMVLLAFRHGLRASELCSLRWDQADLAHGRLHVNRLKNGIASVHPLTGIELRALRRLQREQKPGRYVFMSERGAPMSAVAFRRMVTRLGPAAKMPFGIHPDMLRHSTGFKLANQGVDTRSLQHYLGHKNIQHTVRYSKLSPDRFRDFWKD